MLVSLLLLAAMSAAASTPSETLWANLASCRCNHVKPSPGDECTSCGLLMEWAGKHASKHMTQCCDDDCESSTGIVDCVTCNYAYHTDCHDFHFGIKRDGSRGAWCQDCFDQIDKDLLTVKTLVDSGAFAYQPPDRAEKPTGMPPTKKMKVAVGKLRVIKQLVDLKPCACETGHGWTSISMACHLISDEQREGIREEYLALWRDPTKGARERALLLPHSGIRKTAVYKPTSAIIGQKCAHCKHLDKAEQSPTESHTLRKCGHNNGKMERLGGTIKTEYFLWDSKLKVHRQVHEEFYRNTYGLSKES